jgi:hypothetical protein
MRAAGDVNDRLISHLLHEIPTPLIATVMAGESNAGRLAVRRQLDRDHLPIGLVVVAEVVVEVEVPVLESVWRSCSDTLYVAAVDGALVGEFALLFQQRGICLPSLSLVLRRDVRDVQLPVPRILRPANRT